MTDLERIIAAALLFLAGLAFGATLHQATQSQQPLTIGEQQ